MIKIFLWFIFSYIFGSIPAGYILVKIIAKKDIRNIGRKKVSASNIIHNIGWAPGIFAGAFDIFKGVFAVGGAWYLGFSPVIQALAGVFAVCGQMWPLFLKFWGGRGGGTSIGAICTLNFGIGIFLVGFWLLCKLISKEYGSSIGMMLAYVLGAGIGFYLKYSEVYTFCLLCLPVMLLQRLLGEPGSITKIKNKKTIIWRLLLDRDTKERMESEKRVW